MNQQQGILFISQVFYPDQVSTASLFTDLCADLVDRGIEVEIWSAQPSYTETKRQQRRNTYRGMTIFYLPSTHFHKSVLIGRLLNYLTFMISVIVRLLFSKDRSPVFSHTTPPSIGIIVAWICSLKRRKFVYILHDIFPEGLIRLGIVSSRNPFIRLWARMFLSALKKSHRIVVIGRDMQEWLGDVYQDGLQKTEYIPLWQNENLVGPGSFEQNSIVNKFELQDKFVVQYSGNMGLWHDMETIARAANELADDVFFLFIGSGRREEELFGNLQEDSRNFLKLPFQPMDQLNESLSACHVAIVSFRPNLQGMAVPSKIYGIMAAGIPVIALAPEKSEISLIIKEESCGFVVLPNDLNALIQSILELKNNESVRLKMGSNARNAFEKKYTLSTQTVRYKKLVETLISQ